MSGLQGCAGVWLAAGVWVQGFPRLQERLGFLPLPLGVQLDRHVATPLEDLYPAPLNTETRKP